MGSSGDEKKSKLRKPHANKPGVNHGQTTGDYPAEGSGVLRSGVSEQTLLAFPFNKVMRLGDHRNAKETRALDSPRC